MSVIEYEQFHFRIQELDVKTIFAQRYEFTTPLSDFTAIDTDITIEGKKLVFPNTSEKSAENKMNRIIDSGLKNMIHTINRKKVLYIDEESRIPLLGSGEFGIIDRNTNILEIKPLTGCNLNCIYCSVDEGVNKKSADILIDPYYLAQQAAIIAGTKTHEVEFNIGPHGEPLLYPFMEELITELSNIPNVHCISINTNGIMLDENTIDTLKQAGLSRINLSLNTLDQDMVDKLSGKKYPLKHILKMVEYANKAGMAVLLAPVVIPGYNDNPKRDIEPLVKLSTTLTSPYPTIGFQNFLNYKGGRNPAEQRSFEEFFALLEPFEKKYGIVLTPKQDYNPFKIYEDKTIEKPMFKNQTIKVEIKSMGRTPKEKICVAQNRVVTVRGLLKEKGFANVKIIRDKHNIFTAVA